MATSKKTLEIQVITDVEKGLEDLHLVAKEAHELGLQVTGFNTKLRESDKGVKEWVTTVKLLGGEAVKLESHIDKLKTTLQSLSDTENKKLTADPFKETVEFYKNKAKLEKEARYETFNELQRQVEEFHTLNKEIYEDEKYIAELQAALEQKKRDRLETTADKFKEITSEQLRLSKQKVDLETAIAQKGADSLEAIEIRTANNIKNIRKNLLDELRSIEAQLAEGTLKGGIGAARMKATSLINKSDKAILEEERLAAEAEQNYKDERNREKAAIAKRQQDFSEVERYTREHNARMKASQDDWLYEVIKAGEEEQANYDLVEKALAATNKRRERLLQERYEAEYAYNEKIRALNSAYLKQHINQNIINPNPEAGRINERTSIFAEMAREEEENAKRLLSYTSMANKGMLDDLQRRLKVEQSATVNGKDHLKTIELQFAREEANIRRELAAELAEIDEKIKNKTITTAIEADRARISAEENAAKKITAARTELDSKLPRVDEINKIHTGFYNLAKRIGEVYLIWGALNTISSKFSEAIRSIIPVGIALDSVKASLESTIGSGEATAAVLRAINLEANRTGLEIGNLRTSFKLFQASTSLAGASLEDTWKMFTNINTVSTALHLTTEETNHVFLALAQLFNKSKVQAEELVKQLGNLLPGAYASFAASIKNADGTVGISTQELTERMKQGIVSAQKTMLDFTEFLAKRFAGSFTIASQMLNADIGRMKTEFTLLGEAIYGVSSGPIQETVQGITSLTRSVKEFVKEEKEFNKAVNLTKDALIAAAVLGIGAYISRKKELILKSRDATKETSLFKESLASLASFNPIVAFFTGLTLSLTDYIHGLHEGISETNRFIAETEKLRNQSVAPPEVKLQMAIDEDAAVIKMHNQMKEVYRRFSAVSKGEFGSLAITSKEREEINALLPVLRQYDSTLQEITEEEQRGNVNKQNFLNILAAEGNYFGQELGRAKERARLAENVRQEKEKAAEVENRYGIEPKKQLDKSEVLQAEVDIYESLATKAKAAGDEIKALDYAQKALNASYEVAKQKIDEVYNAEQAYIKDTLAFIEKRKSDKTYDDTDRKKEIELLQKQADLQKKIDGEKAKAEEDFIKRKESIKSQYVSDKKLDFTDSERSLKNFIKTQDNLLQESKNNFEQGTISIGEYITNLTNITTETLQKEWDIYNNNLVQAEAIGDKNNISKFEQALEGVQAKYDSLNIKVKDIWQSETTKFNEQVDSIEGLRYSLSGERGKGAGELFDVEHAKEFKAIIRENAGGALMSYQIARANFILEKDQIDLQKQKQILDDTYDRKLQRINILKENGVMTEWQALHRITDLNKLRLQQLEEQISKQKEAIATAQAASPGGITNPESERQLNILQQELENLKTTGDNVASFIESRFSDAFANMLTDLGKIIVLTKDSTGYERQLNYLEDQRAELEQNVQMEQHRRDVIGKINGQKVGDNRETYLLSKIKETDREIRNLNKGATDMGPSFKFSLEAAQQAFISFSTTVVNEIANIAAKEATSAIVGNILKPLVGGLFGGGFSNYDPTEGISVAGTFKGVGGISAKGNIFNKDAVPFAKGGSFTNSIVSEPTMFRFAKGTKLGQMGEAGPEAIMPLVRDKKGRLGVISEGGSEGGIYFGDISISVERNSGEDGEQLGNSIAVGFMRKIASEEAKREIFKAKRPGNTLNSKRIG